MFAYLTILATVSLAGQPDDNTPPPNVAFVKSPVTQKHVAIQPRRDHHRIHFLLRARDAARKRMYAAVVCRTQDDQGQVTHESVRRIFFIPDRNNQLFAIYLRAPKFSQTNANYEIHLGKHIPGQPDVCVGGFMPLNGFSWDVKRLPNSSVQFTSKAIQLTYSIARAVGGKVRVESRALAFNQMLDFGTDRSHDRNNIDGKDMARPIRINQENSE